MGWIGREGDGSGVNHLHDHLVSRIVATRGDEVTLGKDQDLDGGTRWVVDHRGLRRGWFNAAHHQTHERHDTPPAPHPARGCEPVTDRVGSTYPRMRLHHRF